MNSNASRAGGGAELTAIDVLLEPDVTMVSKAEAANARLRENFPTGYALDALHAPISRCFSATPARVISNSTSHLTLAVQRVFETEHLAELQMKARGYYYLPFTEKGDVHGTGGHRH